MKLIKSEGCITNWMRIDGENIEDLAVEKQKGVLAKLLMKAKIKSQLSDVINCIIQNLKPDVFEELELSELFKFKVNDFELIKSADEDNYIESNIWIEYNGNRIEKLTADEQEEIIFGLFKREEIETNLCFVISDLTHVISPDNEASCVYCDQCGDSIYQWEYNL